MKVLLPWMALKRAVHFYPLQLTIMKLTVVIGKALKYLFYGSFASFGGSEKSRPFCPSTTYNYCIL
jgi:hypothetical protein